MTQLQPNFTVIDYIFATQHNLPWTQLIKTVIVKGPNWPRFNPAFWKAILHKPNLTKTST